MSALPEIAVAEQLAERIAALDVPAAVREKCIDLAVDVIGLCVTARNEDYVAGDARRLRRRRPLHGDRPCAHA